MDILPKWKGEYKRGKKSAGLLFSLSFSEWGITERDRWFERRTEELAKKIGTKWKGIRRRSGDHQIYIGPDPGIAPRRGLEVQ